MSYLVLARKHRPQTFEQVVQQQHVTQTLAHAIVANRVAHAILFSGPRGTGKTTVARILAKGMNCDSGPTPEPCNVCRSCTEITAGSATDVYEIDGASNNSVDQVRELRENIKYMPAHSTYKIYIIDEVHMLSIAAFNALLKTLEEPPSHVLFFFATTESHRMPITILSRCQRYDFRRIDTDGISNHLRVLCQKEGIQIADEGLKLIAQEAGGSMRDALSLLDQVMACAEGEVDHAQVLDTLGLIDRKLLFDLSEATLKGGIGDVLKVLDDIYTLGHDMKKLYEDLVAHFRNLLIVRMGRDVETLVDLPLHEIELMRDQTRMVSAGHISEVIDLLFKEEAAVRYGSDPRLTLEMLFIRLLKSAPILPIDTLIEKLDLLRKEFDKDDGSGTPKQKPAPAPVSSSLVAPQRVRTSGREPASDTHPKGTDPISTGNVVPDISEIWQKMTAVASDRHPSLAASLTRCRVKAVGDGKIILVVDGNGFAAKNLRKNKNLAILRKIYYDLTGDEIDFDIAVGEDPEKEKRASGKQDSRLKNEALSHPRIADAIEIFDGKVLDVKLL